MIDFCVIGFCMIDFCVIDRCLFAFESSIEPIPAISAIEAIAPITP